MTDDEHVDRVVKAVAAMSDAIAAARKDGLTVELVELSVREMPYAVTIKRTTTLYGPE